MSDMNIGQEIIILRSKRGWTQQFLADKLQTTVRTICAWEAGDSVPRNAMKVKIANVFELPEDYFLIQEDTSGEDSKTSDVEKRRQADAEDVLEFLAEKLSQSGSLSEEQKKACLSSCYESLFGQLLK